MWHVRQGDMKKWFCIPTNRLHREHVDAATSCVIVRRGTIIITTIFYYIIINYKNTNK